MADEKNLNEEEEMTVTLTLDDDSEIECVVLNIFSAGDREYIALLPMEGADSEEGEVYLYRYSETEDGTPVLDNIVDDDAYEKLEAYKGEVHFARALAYSELIKCFCKAYDPATAKDELGVVLVSSYSNPGEM